MTEQLDVITKEFDVIVEQTEVIFEEIDANNVRFRTANENFDSFSGKDDSIIQRLGRIENHLSILVAEKSKP